MQNALDTYGLLYIIIYNKNILLTIYNFLPIINFNFWRLKIFTHLLTIHFQLISTLMQQTTINKQQLAFSAMSFFDLG